MNWLRELFGMGRAGGSGRVAKDRLKFVLEFDRAQLTPLELDQIRDEIIATISRHVNVRTQDVEIKLESGGRLVAHIPLDRGRESL